MTITEQNGLINAFILDGKGGGKAIDWRGIHDWREEQGVLWVHLNFTQEGSQRWLLEESGLDALVAQALIADETRPRSAPVSDGLMISLRGVNSNPGADPEDMVSIRLFCTEERVVSTRRRRLLTIRDLVEALEQGRGPRTAGELTAMLTHRLIDRMSEVINDLDDRIDEVEESILEGELRESRSQVIELRREIIKLRRYLSPQREALGRLQNEAVSWLTAQDRLSIRESSDKITRYVEELDSSRDRAGVANEELTSRLSEQLNSRMYVLSLVAGLFLPLGFLTGLLGINVGGIPLAESPWGFLEVVVFLLFVALIQIMLFWRKRWF
ncbi:MAG: zinc transporter ZntB [Candidatus Thiodiazotropha sp.]